MIDRVATGPLTGWPIWPVSDGAIAVGRYSWHRISGTFTADQAWDAWAEYVRAHGSGGRPR